MKPETAKKFDDIVKKEFQYKGHIIKIQNYKEFSSGTVVVTSDLQNFNLLPNEFEAFFNQLKAVDPTIPVVEINEDKRQFPPAAVESIKVHDTADIKEEKVPETSQEVTAEAKIYNPIAESKTVKDNLMAMMDLVKRDPKSLPQAKAMVDIANSIVGIQKNEIQVFQMLNKHNPKAAEQSSKNLLNQ